MQKEPVPVGEPPTAKRQCLGDDPIGTGSKEPLVCCVCLTRDRPEMLQRAIACFRAQTYQRKRLIIWDTSAVPFALSMNLPDNEHCIEDVADYSIGELRNRANSWTDYGTEDCSVIIHWDDDDWSHPARIAEQVALLKSRGKEAVGYREMLFWRTARHATEDEIRAAGLHPVPGVALKDIGFYPELRTPEAWLFSSGLPRYCLGTSLCYWRSVWERRPFEDVQTGEDYAWLKGVDSLGVDSTFGIHPASVREHNAGPRMIASIHGGNTSPVYKREYLEGSQAQRGEWKRVPQWDDYCRQTMEPISVDTSRWRMTKATNE